MTKREFIMQHLIHSSANPESGGMMVEINRASRIFEEIMKQYPLTKEEMINRELEGML